MKYVIKKTLCDICGRYFDAVDTQWDHGYGTLVFTMNAGGDGGGASYSEKYDDICVKCCHKLVNYLKKDNINKWKPLN